MPGTIFLRCLSPILSFPRLGSSGSQSLGLTVSAVLETWVLLLMFTLAIFVVLVFAVRVLMVVTKKPIPIDPFDMAKPTGFRAVMLGGSVLLAPLIAMDFLPLKGMDAQWVLPVAYLLEILVAAILWLALYLFYKVRDKRPRRGT